MLPWSALKESKAFQILHFSLLDFSVKVDCCFSQVPPSFLANSRLNCSYFKKDSLQLIFLQWVGDNSCRNSPLNFFSYYLWIEGKPQQSLSPCLEKALFLLVTYLFMLQNTHWKFSFKAGKTRGWACSWGDVGLLLCCHKLPKWPWAIHSAFLYVFFLSSVKCDNSTSLPHNKQWQHTEDEDHLYIYCTVDSTLQTNG